MSTLFSFAILRTSGEERWRRASSTDSGTRPDPRDSGPRSGSRDCGTRVGSARGTGAALANTAAGCAGAADPAGMIPLAGTAAGGRGAACPGSGDGIATDGGGGTATDGDGEIAAGGDGATSAVEPDARMTATTLLTGTVSPAFARISATTPATGDGISASTLSVEISKSGSSGVPTPPP